MSKLVVSIGHVEFTGGSQVLYVIKVQQDGDEWEVRRTFSDFRKLRDDVARVMKDARAHVVDDECSREFARAAQALPFPAKRLFGSKKDNVVKERAVELHHFLIRLLVLTHTYRKAQKSLYEHAHAHGGGGRGSHQQQQQAAFAALQDRVQASVSVFYLLRDFLKPVTLRTNVNGEQLSSNGARGGAVGDSAQLEGEGEGDDEASQRMIRESKMLQMSIGPRGSGPSHLKPSASAPSRTLSHRSETPRGSKSPRNEPAQPAQSTRTHEHLPAPAPAPIPVAVVPPSESPSKANGLGHSASAGHRTARSNSKLVSVAAAGRSRSASRLQTPAAAQHKVPTESLSDGRKRQGSASRVTKASSMSALAAQVERARTESYMLRDQLLQQRQEKQKQERTHQQHAREQPPTSDPSQLERAPQGTSDQKQRGLQTRSGDVPRHHAEFMKLAEQHQEQRHHSSAKGPDRLKTSSHPLDTSESSQASGSEQDGHRHAPRALSSASAGSAREAKHVLLTPEMTEILAGGNSSSADGKASSEKRRARAKRTGRGRRKGESARDIQQRESERLSRLSVQLTAQSVSVSAQKELERFVSEYTAIMVLRYVDRFISKAVSKAPGCYRVDAATRKLVIDGERFCEELEETFTDLPASFPSLFKDDTGEWSFPPALDAYAQFKWTSFQGSSRASTDKPTASARVRAASGDDSDSDSDYEYEQIGGGGYMKAKKTFSNDEESMLQEMIANGTAGKDQMLRLRRQINERGWNRRENPGSRSRRELDEDEDEDDVSSDTEEEDGARRRGVGKKSKSSCAVDQYQRRQNALRKDRLSHAQSIGGLV